MDLQAALRRARIVPVITINDADAATGLAEALRDGGLPVLEVTLRTEAGLSAIMRIARDLEGVVVGAGTVRTAQQYREAREAGAQFIVSPGCTPDLLSASRQHGGLFLPGAVTASEVMTLADAGLSLLKFFPAESSGGAGAVKSFSGPFPDISFCPTGGIDLARAREYLALNNVVCVGGTWMVPQQLVDGRGWAQIRELAAAAVSELRTEP